MGSKSLYSIAVLSTFLLIVLSMASPGIENIHSYTDNAVEGDFSVVWYSKNILHYDEFYVVVPNFVSKEMSLVYGRDIVCRSLSITISSIGVYTFHTTVNGSQQYVYVDGGIIRVQLTNLSTNDVIADQFGVPGLYAVYISVAPSTIWVRDPATGGMTRAQQLILHIEGYGTENIRKSYSISGVLPVVSSLVVSSIAYNAVTATISHYITVHIVYPQKPHSVLIVFSPSAEDQQQVVATVTEVLTVTKTITPLPVVSVVTSTLVLEKTTTREVVHTSTTTSIVPTYVTTVRTLPTTIERSTTITTTATQTVEKGYGIHILVGAVILSVLVSVSLTLLLVSRRLL